MADSPLFSVEKGMSTVDGVADFEESIAEFEQLIADIEQLIAEVQQSVIASINLCF